MPAFPRGGRWRGVYGFASGRSVSRSSTPLIFQDARQSLTEAAYDGGDFPPIVLSVPWTPACPRQRSRRSIRRSRWFTLSQARLDFPIVLFPYFSKLIVSVKWNLCVQSGSHFFFFFFFFRGALSESIYLTASVFNVVDL